MSEKTLELDRPKEEKPQSCCHVSESPSPQWVVSSCMHVASVAFAAGGPTPPGYRRDRVLEADMSSNNLLRVYVHLLKEFQGREFEQLDFHLSQESCWGEMGFVWF